MEQNNNRQTSAKHPLQGFFHRNRRMLLLGGLFLLGVAAGSFCFAQQDSTMPKAFSLLASRHLELMQEMSYGRLVWSVAWPLLCLLGLILFLGFCAVSQPILLFLLVFDGLGVGFTMAYCCAGGTAGAGFGAGLFLLPTTILSHFVLLPACRSALGLSCGLYHKMAGRFGQELLPVIRRYLIEAVGYFLVLMGAVLLHAGAVYLGLQWMNT